MRITPISRTGCGHLEAYEGDAVFSQGYAAYVHCSDPAFCRRLEDRFSIHTVLILAQEGCENPQPCEIYLEIGMYYMDSHRGKHYIQDGYAG